MDTPNEHIYVGCFSKDSKTSYLWNEYAGKNGVCLKFSNTHQDDLLIVPVIYGKEEQRKFVSYVLNELESTEDDLTVAVPYLLDSMRFIFKGE